MAITTSTGTLDSGAVIFDRSTVAGMGRGDKINLYLDFTRGGSETVTLSFSVKSSQLGTSYYYVSYLNATFIVTKQTAVLNLTGKYIIPITIGKDVEFIKIEQSGLSTSALIVDVGLDNYYA